jgi:O-antigen/teichoic acid export membrane protein
MGNIKKVRNNLIMGVSSQLLTALLAILVPRFILISYGSEVNGLISSVTQIYTYIALLEAGVGTATVQALYRTITDKDSMNAILSATNRYYHRTGVMYLIAIAVFAAVYPLVIQTDIPWHTIVLVILFNGLGSVINYFFQGKYFLLLQAEGKNYIQTTLQMLTNVFKNLATILLISFGFDVVFVQMIAMFVSLIQMIYISWYIKRHYSWIDLSVKPDYPSISQSRNVLVHQISLLVFSNTDIVVLSIFCGLKTSSVYSLYSMLLGLISKTLSIITSSLAFTLGHSFHQDKERFMKLYDTYELYYITLAFALYSVANYFMLPFLRLYTSGVSDINYIDRYLPLLFISVSLLACSRNASGQAINVAGHFKLTQYRSVAEAVINIVVSLICVNFFGIYGVLFGTITALLYRANDMVLYAARHILKRSPLITYKRWGVNLLLFVAVLFLNRFILLDINSYLTLALYCIPYTACVMILFFGVSSLADWKTAKYAIGYVKLRLQKNKQ